MNVIFVYIFVIIIFLFMVTQDDTDHTFLQVIYQPLPGPYEPFGNTGIVESPTPLSGSPGNPYTFSLSTTDLTLSGLSPYTEYCITVFASTSAGDGLSSSIVVQTKEIGKQRR